LRNGRKVVPVMSLVSREDLIASLPNAITFEKQPMLQKFMELFSLSSGRHQYRRTYGGIAVLPAGADAGGNQL
jgi:hypothetical protein